MLMPGEAYVSRDAIRFAMVAEDEPYFSKEDEVFDKFVKTIDLHLAANQTVYADATHLNYGSRMKLLNALSVKPDAIEIIYMKTPLKVCLERNATRKGTRAFVPEDVLEKMHRGIKMPKWREGEYEYAMIWIKKPDCVIEEKEGKKDVNICDERFAF